jgi:hypothetical protein
MSPRIIQIPLSGGDRKAQANGIRQVHGLSESYFERSQLIRSAAEEKKIREADRLECAAWNAAMWAGGPARPAPGEAQADPTIGKAINGGYRLLEAKCNRCRRVSIMPGRQPTETPVWKREAESYAGRAVRSGILQSAPARPCSRSDVCSNGSPSRRAD